MDGKQVWLHINAENKVNSLILDYEIVLGLRISEKLGFKCLVKVASSSYNYYCQ